MHVFVSLYLNIVYTPNFTYPNCFI